MEKIGALIKRLQEQYDEQANADNLRLTAQMLLNELQEINKQAVFSGKKVAVIMPANHTSNVTATPVVVNKPAYELPKPPKEFYHQPVIEEQKAEEVPEPEIIENTTVAPVEEKQPIAEIIAPVELPVVEPVKPVQEIKEETSSHKNGKSYTDLPTFAYQPKEVYELNDSMADKGESLNERLKSEKAELGSVLKDAPVRDLRKAIGINDRFVFINELFRGDEIMYERSIKTINAFNILPEAEYWIQRELKLKIGWQETSETVQHFDQLVRRRFS